MPRTLRSDMADVGGAFARAFGGGASIVAGAVTGLQAALLSLVAVVALALAAAAGAPSPDGSAAIDWGAASGAGTRVWLLAFGVPLVAGGVVVDLVPLGLTAAIGAGAFALAHRFAAATVGSALASGAIFALVVAVAALATGSSAGAAVGGSLAAGALAAVVTGAGAARARGTHVSSPAWAPVFMPRGLALGAGILAAGVALAATAFFALVVVGWSDIGEAATALDADPVGVAVAALLQLAYVPVMLIWMLTWLTGVGFVVGSGSVYAPAEIAAEPVPLVPLLGALPSAAGGPLVWAPVLIALAAVGARLLSGPRDRAGRDTVAASLIAVAFVFGSVATLTWLATGSAGGDHLRVVGSDWLAVGTAAAGLVAAGLAAAEAGVALAARVRMRSETARSRPSTPAGRPQSAPGRR